MKNTDLIAAVGGIERAREIVGGAHYSAFGYDYVDAEYICGGDIQDGYSINDCEGCVCLNDLRTAIAEHDCAVAKPEFKVGDLVVLNQSHSQANILKIEMFRGDFIRAFVVDSSDYSFGHKINFRHATPAEIKAGCRINGALTNEGTKVGVLGDSDDVADISYHVSPSAVVINEN